MMQSSRPSLLTRTPAADTDAMDRCKPRAAIQASHTEPVNEVSTSTSLEIGNEPIKSALSSYDILQSPDQARLPQWNETSTMTDLAESAGPCASNHKPGENNDITHNHGTRSLPSATDDEPVRLSSASKKLKTFVDCRVSHP